MNWNGDKSIKMNLDKTGKSDKTGTTNRILNMMIYY